MPFAMSDESCGFAMIGNSPGKLAFIKSATILKTSDESFHLQGIAIKAIPAENGGAVDIEVCCELV
jgi:hypothetical protein